MKSKEEKSGRGDIYIVEIWRYCISVIGLSMGAKWRASDSWRW